MSATDDENDQGLQELREIPAERLAAQAHLDRLDKARNKLIHQLAANGVTQVELAEACGISQPAIWKILNRAAGE